MRAEVVVTPDAAVPPLDVSLTERGRWVVAEVAGELDFGSCPMLRAALETVLTTQPRPHVAVDLSGLDFCDSSGLGCLVATWKLARGRRGALVVLNPDVHLRRLLAVTGLDQVLPVVACLQMDGEPGDDDGGREPPLAEGSRDLAGA